MIDPEAAWARLLPFLTPLAAERLPRRAAAGRRLAAATVATTDLPPCDLSALDGFALAGAAGESGWFEVEGTRFAGDPAGPTLEPGLARGTALRIMTGSAVPPGADRVVGVEDTVSAGERMRPTAEVAPGAAIRRQGEIILRGAPLLPAGALLTPAALALLASQGIGEVAVHRAPRLALQLTGNEIVPPEATPAAGQLRDSHSDFLLAELDRLNLPVRSLGIARDEPETLAASLRAGLEGTDVLLCCGGVSMGEADFLAPVLAELGFATLFHGVAIQPGKPLLVAHRVAADGVQLAFGLPGNPASVMVAWWLFVRPALERLLGAPAGFWACALPGTLGGPLGAGRKRDRFVPATWRLDGGRPILVPISPKGSHDLLAFGLASALVRIRAGAPAAAAGVPCEWMRLDG
jgi:molybdopterin molybdotransferase